MAETVSSTGVTGNPSTTAYVDEGSNPVQSVDSQTGSSTFETTEQTKDSPKTDSSPTEGMSIEEQLLYAFIKAALEKQGYILTITDGKVTLTKKEDVRVQQAIDQYGADSPEVQSIRDELKQYDITEAQQEDEIANLYNQKLIDVLSGNIKLTPEQNEFAESESARRKNIALDGLNSMLSEIDKTGESISSELSKYNDLIMSGKVSQDRALDVIGGLIEQRGMDVKSALELVNTTIGETDKTVGESLEKSFNQSRALAKMGLQEQADKMQADINNQAALLGRNPTDPNFQRAFMDQTQKNIQEVELALGINEADKRAALAASTGAKREELAKTYADLENSLGLAREGVASKRFDVETETQNRLQEVQRLNVANAENTGLRRESAQGGYNTQMNNIGSDIFNLRTGLATGLPYQSLNAGATGQQLDQSLQNQQVANLQSIFGSAALPYQAKKEEEANEPTLLDWLNSLGALGIGAGSLAV